MVHGARAQNLLRAHVLGRSYGAPGGGHAVSAHGDGDAEIGDLHVPVGVQHQVRRLHVAVNDAVPVRVVERAERLPGPFYGMFQGQRAAGASDRIGYGAARYPLHENGELAVLLDEILDLGDVRVGEARLHLGFGHEALLEFRVARELVGQNLNGDAPPQDAVTGEPHFGHPADAELPLEQPRSECATGRHIRFRVPPSSWLGVLIENTTNRQ